jgi:hypothetical protein
MERYAVSLAVLGSLVLVIVLLPANSTTGAGTVIAGLDTADDFDGFNGGLGSDSSSGFDDGESSADGGGSAIGSGTDSGIGGAAGGGSSRGSGTPGAPQTATTLATAAPSHAFGQGPCRPDGRQNGISAYMPPCVSWLSAPDNGGSTDRGVTADQVKIVRWVGQVDDGTRAILQGSQLFDPPDVIERAYRALFRYSNLHYDSYGREVVFIDVEAGGISENEPAMKADALKIANEIKPFAVIDGDPAAPVPPILARELAHHGIPCACTASLSSAFYTALPPVIFGALPVMDLYSIHTAEYIDKKLAGKNAIYAGDELNPTQGYNSSPRKFGLVFREGTSGVVDPVMQLDRDTMKAALAARGIPLAVEIGYTYDPGRNQQDMTNVINQLKAAGVTTVIPLWDPLTPIILTKEATRQNYFPEWFVVGTGLSDTNAGGRLYDQLQWQHAFGISPLWVTWDTVPHSAGYREYHHAVPGGADGDEGVLINIYRERVQMIFRGIHMAGPDLTVANWAKGILAYPPTGGTAALPLRYLTREAPGDIQDFVEVWWDADRTGRDERGENGPGMMMRANNAKRYQAGEWTTDPSLAFVSENTLTVSDDLPGDYDHEADGHTHEPDERCLTC